MDVKYLFILVLVLLNISNFTNCSVAKDLLNSLTVTPNLFLENEIDNDKIKLNNSKILTKFKRNVSPGYQIPTVNPDVYVLQELSEVPLSPVAFAYDLEYFHHEQQGGVWYVATLEHREGADFLVVYREQGPEAQGPKWLEINHVPVRRGLKLHLYTQQSTTYIVTVEDEQLGCQFCQDGSSIWEFDEHEFIHKVQNIDILFPSEVNIWNDMNDIFLAVTQNTFHSQDKSLIYRWLGRHFDIVQALTTNNALKMVTFNIEHLHFLAVANHNDESGNTEIYSEIFIYDIHDERFVSYQKILTHAAVDVKYFCFKQGHKHEHFLVVANGYETDMNGVVDYDTVSIVYKFVDDYFIPFQSLKLSHVNQFLPIVGPNSEFALLAFCDDGIKAYQYDGWRFIVNHATYNNPEITTGITKVQTYRYYDGIIIVTINKNHKVNILTPTFIHQNYIENFNNAIQQWCHGQHQIEIEGLEKMKHDFENRFEGGLYKKRSRRATDDNVTLQEFLLRERIEELEALLTETIVLEGDVSVGNLSVLNGETHVGDLHAQKINQEDLETFFKDVYFLDDSFEVDPSFQFEEVRFEKGVYPQKINGHVMEDVIKLSNPRNILVVEGNVTVDDLQVEGKIGGVKVNERLVLTNEGAQILPGRLTGKNLTVDKIHGHWIYGPPDEKKEVKSINIENLVVQSINGLSFPALSDQVLLRDDLENVTFESLVVKDLQVDGFLSGTKVPDSLALTEGSTVNIHQDLTFFQPLEAKHLHVIKNLNQLQSSKGHLQVLLKNSPKKQFLQNHLTVDDLHLTSLIKLQGQIVSSGTDLDKLNPVLTIDDDLILTANFSIDGSVTVWNLLKFEELHDDEAISFKKVKEEGLRLGEEVIDVPVYFGGGLSVDNVNAALVNGEDPRSWYISEVDDLHSVSEWSFSRSIHIDGFTNIVSINGVNVSELFERSLRVSGDQVITAHHHYASVKTDSIQANSTLFIPSTNEVREKKKRTLIVEGDSYFENLEATRVFSKMVNGHIWKDLLEDTIFHEKGGELSSFKTFEREIDVKNLFTAQVNDLEFQRLKEQLERWSGDLVFEDGFEISGDISIGSLRFGEMNGIAYENFGRVWLLRGGVQEVSNGVSMGKVNFNNLLTIRSSSLNSINFLELLQNARRVDREERFVDAIFAVGCTGLSHLKTSAINEIPVGDFLLSNFEQNIYGDFRLISNLRVNGYLFVNGHSNGVSFNELCNFSNRHYGDNKGLVVKGNVHFTSSNDVKFVSEFNLAEIRETSWHLHDAIHFDGYNPLYHVHIDGELFVEGYTDNINLEWTASSYFSKSMNQTIAAKVSFGEVRFLGSLHAPGAYVPGRIGGINMEAFLEQTLRHEAQRIGHKVEFDEIEVVSYLNVESLVNGLNLSTDAMRRDILKNVFRGTQSILNLNTKDLFTPEGTYIQGISTMRWLNNLVSLSTPNEISGKKGFQKVEIQSNLFLGSTLNSFLITEDHILTRSSPQVIKSMKNFHYDLSEPTTLDLRNLKLRGLLNDLNMTDFLKTQMKVTESLILVENSKIFANGITAENVDFQATYQGVAVPKVVEDILKLDTLNNFADEYRALMEGSSKLLESSKSQAWYLDHYRTIQTIKENIVKVVPLVSLEGASMELLLQVRDSNGLHFYRWNPQEATFTVLWIGSPLYDDYELIDVNVVDFQGPTYFLEGLKKDDGTISGMLFQSDAEETFQLKHVVSNNKTNSITTFQLPNGDTCVALVYEKHVEILCKAPEAMEMYQLQVLEVPNGKQVTYLIIDETLYLFVVNEGYPNVESRVDVWKLGVENLRFELHQMIFITGPNDVDTIYYRGSSYLVISSSSIINSKYFGRVIVSRFDPEAGIFVEIQDLYQKEPLKVKFVELPSHELALYVLTSIPTETLAVYVYDGVAGFRKKVESSTIPSTITSFEAITFQKNHFIVVYNEIEANIIQAQFKGPSPP